MGRVSVKGPVPGAGHDGVQVKSTAAGHSDEQAGVAGVTALSATEHTPVSPSVYVHAHVLELIGWLIAYPIIASLASSMILRVSAIRRASI